MIPLPLLCLPLSAPTMETRDEPSESRNVQMSRACLHVSGECLVDLDEALEPSGNFNLKGIVASRNFIESLKMPILGKVSDSLIALDISGNRLTDLGGIEELHNLRYLDASYNVIYSLTNGLPKCRAAFPLTVFKLAGNSLVSANGVQGLHKLEQIDLRENLIRDAKNLHVFPELAASVSSVSRLQVAIASNPVTRRSVPFNEFVKALPATIEFISNDEVHFKSLDDIITECKPDSETAKENTHDVDSAATAVSASVVKGRSPDWGSRLTTASSENNGEGISSGCSMPSRASSVRAHEPMPGAGVPGREFMKGWAGKDAGQVREAAAMAMPPLKKKSAARSCQSRQRVSAPPPRMESDADHSDLPLLGLAKREAPSEQLAETREGQHCILQSRYQRERSESEGCNGGAHETNAVRAGDGRKGDWCTATRTEEGNRGKGRRRKEAVPTFSDKRRDGAGAMLSVCYRPGGVTTVGATNVPSASHLASYTRPDEVPTGDLHDAVDGRDTGPVASEHSHVGDQDGKEMVALVRRASRPRRTGSVESSADQEDNEMRRTLAHRGGKPHAALERCRRAGESTLSRTHHGDDDEDDDDDDGNDTTDDDCGRGRGSECAPEYGVPRRQDAAAGRVALSRSTPAQAETSTTRGESSGGTGTTAATTRQGPQQDEVGSTGKKTKGYSATASGPVPIASSASKSVTAVPSWRSTSGISGRRRSAEASDESRLDVCGRASPVVGLGRPSRSVSGAGSGSGSSTDDMESWRQREAARKSTHQHKVTEGRAVRGVEEGASGRVAEEGSPPWPTPTGRNDHLESDDKPSSCRGERGLAVAAGGGRSRTLTAARRRHREFGDGDSDGGGEGDAAGGAAGRRGNRSEGKREKRCRQGAYDEGGAAEGSPCARAMSGGRRHEQEQPSQQRQSSSKVPVGGSRAAVLHGRDDDRWQRGSDDAGSRMSPPNEPRRRSIHHDSRSRLRQHRTQCRQQRTSVRRGRNETYEFESDASDTENNSSEDEAGDAVHTGRRLEARHCGRGEQDSDEDEEDYGEDGSDDYLGRCEARRQRTRKGAGEGFAEGTGEEGGVGSEKEQEEDGDDEIDRFIRRVSRRATGAKRCRVRANAVRYERRTCAAALKLRCSEYVPSSTRTDSLTHTLTRPRAHPPIHALTGSLIHSLILTISYISYFSDISIDERVCMSAAGGRTAAASRETAAVRQS
eukprot:GHVU01210659.1.p1 GENE.GHVU01210659.1~~GHVU01210659.1.p1  ORF type:complete len:1203 (-),score=147.24 GHVU01210659.1:831-4439(-)